MIHITRLDYIDHKGNLMHSAEVDVWHVRAGIDTLMMYFAAVWNDSLRAAYGYECAEVLCTYKDYSKQPK
ncbi:hypothetical protein SDC9_55031 [bioreactor metagenome]|uniref:Uncharacterized protein n=1 Tax=bioreactor metagenome TaxID=1076179 RepID=A0A644WYD7_9ZZZZ